MRTGLRAEGVLCADEIPTNVVHHDTDAAGKPVPGSPHAVTVRTPDARLVWYAPIGSRSNTAPAGLGVLAGYAGYLVRDDYASYHTALGPRATTPGYTLGQRLHDKADQVWTFTRNLAVLGTNNTSEQALKGPNDIRPSPATGTR